MEELVFNPKQIRLVEDLATAKVTGIVGSLKHELFSHIDQLTIEGRAHWEEIASYRAKELQKLVRKYEDLLSRFINGTRPEEGPESLGKWEQYVTVSESVFLGKSFVTACDVFKVDTGKMCTQASEKVDSPGLYRLELTLHKIAEE